MFELIPLDCLPAGASAKVGRLEGRPEHVKRLEEMGLRQGMTLEVVRPGRPCIVRIGCNRLCLRQDTRLCVFVTAHVEYSRPLAEIVQEHDLLGDHAANRQTQPTVA